MIYNQTLWKEIKDVVNTKILKKQNRFKKWKYGYNSDYDFIVISKTDKLEKSLKYKISASLYQQQMNRLNEVKKKRSKDGKEQNIQKN